MKKLFIPTKSRYNNPLTIKFINSLRNIKNYKVYLVVESEQVEEYKKQFPVTESFDYFILPDSDKGIHYALKTIYKNNFYNNDPFFVIDDDTENFYIKTEEGKQKTIGLDRIEEVLEFLETSPYFFTGLSFRQTHWCADVDFKAFGRSVAFICVQPNKVDDTIKAQILKDLELYDIKYKLHLDVYLNSVLLKNKILTGICYQYAFGTPAMATNEGGCYPEYQKDNSVAECVDEIIKLVGRNFAKKVINKGRIEVKVDWKSLYNFYCEALSLF